MFVANKFSECTVVMCRCISHSIPHLHGVSWLAVVLHGTSSGPVCISWLNHRLAFVSAV